MKRLGLFIIFLSTFIMVYSQRTAKVSATYTFYAPETMSVEEAKRIALERAKIQAIADEFGTLVSQSTATVVSNKNGQTDTQFFSLGGSDVKGEWVKTTQQPIYEIEIKDNTIIVSCKLSGIIKSSEPPAIDFEAHVLCNGTDLKFENTNFKSGDDMYIHFISPYSGYLIAYWIDRKEDRAYQILPYQNLNEPLFKVSRNLEYIFFSKEHALSAYRDITDEYNLTCPDGVEYNELFLCFSEKPFVIPSTQKDFNGLSTISIEKFENWRAKTKQQNNTISKEFHISIISK